MLPPISEIDINTFPMIMTTTITTILGTDVD